MVNELTAPLGHDPKLPEPVEVVRLYPNALNHFTAVFLYGDGHVAVDGRKVNIPSYSVSVGEEISIRENSKKIPILELAKDFASHQNAPNWLEIDRDNYKGRVLALPKREDIQLPVNEQLIVELYSK